MPAALLDGTMGNRFILIACLLIITEWLLSSYLLVGDVMRNSHCCLARAWRLKPVSASRLLLFNHMHIIFDKYQAEYFNLLTPVLLLYRKLLIYLYSSHISCTSHSCMSATHYTGPRAELMVFVKLVIQQPPVKRVVGYAIFGFNSTCLRRREVGGKWETAQPIAGGASERVAFICVALSFVHMWEKYYVVMSWVLAVREWEVVKSGSNQWHRDTLSHRPLGFLDSFWRLTDERRLTTDSNWPRL